MKGDANISLSNSLPLIPTKAPSKILGPLLVYTNKESSQEPLELELLPNITSDENHYYSKKEHHKPIHHNKNDEEHKDSAHKKAEFTKGTSEVPPYLGPILPTATPVHIKPTKLSNKSKPNKILSETHFTKTATQQNDTIEDNIPSQHPQFEIHGKGDPEELLQFINQHPELANYPSGSVFEVHDAHHQNQNTLSNPGVINPIHHQQVIPYAIPNSGDDLPINYNVDHILQHIQKNPQIFEIPHDPQITTQNGHLFLTASNGLVIPTRLQQNMTQPGWLIGKLMCLLIALICRLK